MLSPVCGYSWCVAGWLVNLKRKLRSLTSAGMVKS
jgi:hypothetical protein